MDDMSETMRSYSNRLEKILEPYGVKPNFSPEEQTLTGGVEWKSNGGHKCEVFISIIEKDGNFEASCDGADSISDAEEIGGPEGAIAWLKNQLVVYKHEIQAPDLS